MGVVRIQNTNTILQAVLTNFQQEFLTLRKLSDRKCIRPELAISLDDAYPSEVSVDDLVHYYQTVIRPVLEYTCAVWHPALTKEQTQSLENIQRRALQIIFLLFLDRYTSTVANV